MNDKQAELLGRLLRKARLRRGLSYRELAALSGTDKGWLHKIEHGQRRDPDPVLLLRVGEALGVDTHKLDEIAGGRIGRAMPSVRTYLRTTKQLTDEQIDKVEDMVEAIISTHRSSDPDAAHPASDEATAGARR